MWLACLSLPTSYILVETLAKNHQSNYDQHVSDVNKRLGTILSQTSNLQPRILGEKVCNHCFAHFQGVSESRIYKIKRLLRNSQTTEFVDLRCGGVHQHSPGYMVAYEWLIGYAEMFGDYLPDSNSIQLPVHSVKELDEEYSLKIVQFPDQWNWNMTLFH